jgi:hypothetical protein
MTIFFDFNSFRYGQARPDLYPTSPHRTIIRAGRSQRLTVRVLMIGKCTPIAKDAYVFVIPAEAGIYCSIGTGLRRCDEVDDATADMFAVSRGTYGQKSGLAPAIHAWPEFR